MNYKKIFRTLQTREFMLDLLRFLPDKIMLKLQYKIKTGRTLDINNPHRFTEKLQWYKLNYRNPILHQCVDKYHVREYVKNKGLDNILVELYGKFDSIDDIDIRNFPNSFVMKTTNGGGGLNVVICHDKSKISFEDFNKQLSIKKIKSRTGGREWAYYELEPGIIVEQLLINEENPIAGVNDYKIFCYDGNPEYIVVDVDRYIGHKRNFYDTKWNNLNITSDCPNYEQEISKPENLDDMLAVAMRLSEDFPYVRVDLYSVANKIYFGELTFYPWSGYVQFEPDEFDYEMGKKFKLGDD